jgi:hypothetical protein
MIVKSLISDTFIIALLESAIVPLILKISRHSPENCPLTNEKAKKMNLELMGKLGELTKKHGIKIVGSWNVMPEHLLVTVYDAPSFEAFQKFGMEPDIVKWIAAQDTTEFKIAMTTEESMKLLK